jgi:DNA-damage-inducible protein J
MVHIRLDAHVKTQATTVLTAMGLSASDAVRIFLTRVAVEKRLPFALEPGSPAKR